MGTRCLWFLLLLLTPVLASERFVLSIAGNASVSASGETLVPVQLSAAALTDLLTTPLQGLSPVTFDSVEAGTEWTLGNWSIPVHEMLTQSSASNQTVLVDVQFHDEVDVTVSQLLVQMDNTGIPLDLTLVFSTDALKGLSELVLVHVDGMKTTFEDQWLPDGVDLNQLIFDAATVDNLELETTATIEQLVIRKSNLSFPTAVLGLETAVSTLILEYNTISGPIELTEDEYAQLTNISDFRATGNTVDTSVSGSSCIKEKAIGELAFCIVDDVESSATSLKGVERSGSDDNTQTSGSLETHSNSSPNRHGAVSLTVIVLASACTVVVLVVLSFFRRFKRKASKFVDTFTPNREDELLPGNRSETESERPTGDDKLLADMDLGRDKVTIHKKLGVQGLWLGEYNDAKVVALKFLPRELKMSMNDLNAIRLSYAPLRHDNIVRFLGSTWTDREEVLLVVEHMPKGSLRSVLADEKIELDWPQRLQTSKEICSGLNFVRSIEGMKLSRSLTAKSVFLDAQLTCKLDIFDYASSLRTDLVPVRSYGHGDIASRAPELLKGDEITAAAEVYALGVIFCEISLRSKLFEHISAERGHTMADIIIATEVVSQKLKPSPADNAPTDFRELTLRCLAYEPSDRPNVSEILSVISK